MGLSGVGDGWWFEDGVADQGQEEATVQVHVRGGFSDLNGFHSSPQPEPFDSLFGLLHLPS